MKKYCLLVIVLFLGWSLLFSSGLPNKGWIDFGHDGEQAVAPRVELLDVRDDRLLIEISLEGFGVFTVIENDDEYLRIFIPQTAGTQEIGKPELPQFGRFLQFPFNSEFDVRIIEKETITYDDILLYPVQKKPSRSNPGLTYPFFIDKDFYQTDLHYPSNIISLGDDGILRDIYIARLGINPLQYNPSRKELIVHKRIIAEISIDSSRDSYFFRNAGVSHSFNDLYEQTILNYSENSRNIKTEAESMLVFVADDLEDSIMPLINWKNSKGIRVYKLMMSEVGSNTQSIKNAIQEAYDTFEPKPSYVLLVGHNATVPPKKRMTQFGNAATDYPYTLLEDDQYPDILIGRILAEVPDQVEVQVSKIVNYEQSPYLGPEGDFYGMAFGIASNEGSNPSDEEYISSIADYLLDGTYTYFDYFFQGTGNATAANISAAINEGRTYGTYIGHGSGTSWSNTNTTFNNSTVHNLANGFRLPIIIDVACANGAFDTIPECFGEAWMWAGTAQAPKGAVGYYGGSVSVSWDPPAIMAVGIAKHHFEDPVYSFGGSCLAGQMYLAAQLGWISAVEDNFIWYNIFGDPSMVLRTANPDILEVSHPVLIPAGSTTASVNVSTAKGPFEGALVCIYAVNNPSIYSSAFTDGLGNATLVFDYPVITTDDVYITVSGYNTSVYQTDIMVGSTSDGIINLDRNVYSCDDTAVISLIDADLEGLGTYTVSLVSDTDTEGVDIILTETDILGFFQGEVHVGTDISVSHDDILTVIYFDEDTGDGTSQTKTDTAAIDCLGPEFFNVEIVSITGNSAKITFQTDENAITSFNYGTSQHELDMTQTVSASLRINHTGTISGLEPNTTYYFEIVGTDLVNNESVSTIFSFKTLNILHVGDGSVELTHGPIYCYYKINRTQVIYPASDLGENPLLISSLAFDVTVTPVLQLNNWTIRMKHTDKVDHSAGSGFETGDWTIVYQNDETINETGWVTFVFDEPYYYDGQENLMIDFSFINDSWQSPAGKVKWTQAPSSQAIYAYSDTAGDPLDWSGTTNPTAISTNHFINLQLGLIAIVPEDEGTIAFDREYYACDAEVVVTVMDANVPGGIVIVSLTSTSDPDGYDLLLPEIEEGIFQASFILGTDLQVSHEDILTATYLDEDIGDGTEMEIVTTALIDCVPPEITNISIHNIFGNSAEINFNTNEVARSMVIWGHDCENLNNEIIISNTYETEHAGVISGLTPQTDIFFKVIAMDQADNTAYSECHDFTTANIIGIGNGDIQLDQAPLYTYYWKNRTSVIYLAEEFGQGKKARGELPLYSIAIDVSQVPVNMMNNFTIRLKHTERESFGDNQGMEADGWTVVYQNDEQITSLGWKTYYFVNAPFIYDGESNLMVDISFFNTQWYPISEIGKCRWTATTQPRAVYAYTDSSFGDPLLWEGTSSPTTYNTSNILNVLFTLEESAVPIAPSHLVATTISSEQIDLEWNDNSTNEDGFIVQRKLGADGTWENIAELPQNTEYYQDTDVLPVSTYTYRVYAFNDAGNSGYSNEATANTITLGDALNNHELDFYTDGDALWFGQADEYYYGGASAQSGSITHNQSTSLHTTINGPGELSFWWKVSSENNYDWLSFYINGVLQTRISGDQAWHQKTYTIGPGSHNITWTYEKDPIVSSGQDCGWVDLVVFESGPDASINSSDISYSPSDPLPGDTVYISARVHNVGGEAIDSGNASFYYSLVPNEDLHLIDTAAFGPIPAGDYHDVSISWHTDPDLDPRAYIITVILTDIAPEDINPDNNSAHIELCLPVELAYFTAVGIRNRATISWKTMSEVDNLGFNLYRLDVTQVHPFITFVPVQINDALIPGQGTSSNPRSYTFTDHGIEKGHLYEYILETISTYGETAEYRTRLIRLGTN